MALIRRCRWILRRQTDQHGIGAVGDAMERHLAAVEIDGHTGAVPNEEQSMVMGKSKRRSGRTGTEQRQRDMKI